MKRPLTSLVLAVILAVTALIPARAAGFSDTDGAAWYARAVAWAVDEGIVSGYPDGTFRPNAPCTRAQTAALLHRFAGSPQAKEGPAFSDVPAGHWAHDAVAWCAGAEITAGVSGSRFGPGQVCTRAQIVTFFYRLARAEGRDLSPAADLGGYRDAPAIPAYAREALAWAVGTGLIRGAAADVLSPNDPCTRAQVVTMLWRWAGAPENYETRTVPVYRASPEEKETAKLRFYRDLPNVPYMGLADFYRTFYPDAMTVSRAGDVYTLTQSDGTAAVIDAGADTLETSDLTRFTRLPAIREAVSAVAVAVPFLKTDAVTADRPPAPARLDLGAYGIDLRGDETEVYVPLATLSDLFAGYENYYVAWNGAALYLTDDGRLRYPASAMAEDKDYYEPILSRRERPADLADFAYRELCFNVDAFYGFPGSALLDGAVKEKGLDKALAESAPEVHALLQSPDLALYGTGLVKLMGYYLDDKGHTSFSAAGTLLTDRTHGDLARDVVHTTLQYQATAETPAWQAIVSSAKYARADRAEAFGAETWHTQGDVAVFSFDRFTVDYDGWAAYYDRSGPLPQDTVGTLYRSLEQAEADPAIRYFVLDLTCNGGGDTNALYGVEALILGQPVLRFEDLLTGQRVTQALRADRNLDRVFDRNDDLAGYDLDFALLTSGCTFSCANCLASDCRDAGIPILGEQSGGGGCPIQENVTAEGLPYRLSSWLRFLNEAGQTIDGGVPADVELVVTSTVTHEDKGGLQSQVKDYSACYDLAGLSALLHSLRGQEAPAA